jgi:Rod binding domain-containing protein
MKEVGLDQIPNLEMRMEREIGKAARMLESYFLFVLLKEMGRLARLQGGDFSTDTYTTLLFDRLADFLARRGVGLAEMLEKGLKEKVLKFYGEIGDNKRKIGGGSV